MNKLPGREKLPAPTRFELLSVAGWFRAQAARTPGLVALESDDVEYTYAELRAWVDATSQRLLDVGIGPEQVVAVALPRCPALAVSLLAVNQAGACYMPIDPDLPPERIDYMLREASPAAVLYGCSTERIAGLGQVQSALRIADRPDPVRPQAGPEPQMLVTPPDRPVYLIYTSGSTGRPKGVVMCAGAISNLLLWHLDELGTGPGRRIAQFTAIGFDVAPQEIFSTLVSGATLVIPGEETRRDPRRLVRWMNLRRITDLFCPNLVMEAACEAALELGFTLPALKHIAQGGEQLTLSESVRMFFRLEPTRRLYNHYGPAETHAATSYVLPSAPHDWPDRAPVGRPIWNCAAYVLDAELDPVPPGHSGEVFVSGLGLARGYHGRPGLTAERFLPDPFGGPGQRMYRTGDIALRRPDGMLEYLGRADHQVKIRGVRIELGEIDAAIRAQPEVRDVTVLARGDGASRHLDAYLVPVPGASDVVDRVRERLTQMLPAIMIPSRFTLLAKMPANSNGKADRSALPDPAAPDSHQGPDNQPTLEGTVARLFAECLEVGNISPDDNFFLRGGHSLSAAKLAAEIRNLLGFEVTIADIFRNPSMRKLNEVLRSMDSVTTPVTPVGRDGRLPASFAQERLWILDQFSGPSPLYNVLVLIRLRGRLDVAALRAAINDLLARHEALRTKIVADGSGLRNEVLPADYEVGLPLVVGLAPGMVDEAIRDAALRPFDLGADAPFRAHLFGNGEADHVLLLLIHHAAVDDWSIKPLAKDLSFAYAARLVGMAPPWRPLSVQYADYAAWQRKQFDVDAPSELAVRQTAYWLSVLEGAPEVTSIDCDHERPSDPSYRGDRVPVVLSRELHQAIRVAAQRAECTVFMIVHAALVTLVHLRNGGTDIVIGATVAGRSGGAFDELVGFFVNTLALRVNLSGSPTLNEVVQRVRETDLAAMEHQDLPFDRAVEMMNPVRSMAYNPLVQIMLSFQTGEPEAPQFPHLDTVIELPSLGTAKFDLTFELTESFDYSAAPNGIQGHLEFSTDLFERETARSITSELAALLQIITEDPGREIGELLADGSEDTETIGLAATVA